VTRRMSIYRMITNGVSDYIKLLVRITHIICNHSVFHSYRAVQAKLQTPTEMNSD